MTEEVRVAVQLAAPPETVWRVVMNPRRLADWVTVHSALRGDPPETLRAGSHFDQRLRVAGASFTVSWTVAGCDWPRFASWEGRGPAGSRAGVTYGLEPAGERGTQFTYVNEFELPGGAVGRAAGRRVGRRVGRREAERSLQNLSALLAREDGQGS